MRKGALLVVIAMGSLALAGCVSGKPKQDTYTDRNGVTQAIESPRESCEHSCNAEYDRCGDSDASRIGINGASSMGGAAACSRSLSSCLKACKGR
jgi:hypothetical protein